jgi:HAD superfamily hydrolase (TIGR01509 family)
LKNSSKKVEVHFFSRYKLLTIMKPFKAIFWDNDGTLVNTEPLYVKAIQQVFDDIGYTEKPAKELYLYYTISRGRHVWEPLLEKMNFSENDIQKFRRKRDNYYEKYISRDIKVLDGVKETLSVLHSQIPMAMVTCAQKKHVKAIHKQTGLLPYFDFIIAYEDFTHTKPHPESYLQAATKMNIDPSECLAIEDSERGVVSAKNAGMTCFAIPADLSREGDFSQADKLFNRASDILTEAPIRTLFSSNRFRT